MLNLYISSVEGGAKQLNNLPIANLTPSFPLQYYVGFVCFLFVCVYVRLFIEVCLLLKQANIDIYIFSTCCRWLYC